MSSIGKVAICLLVLCLVLSISASAETWKELLDRADSLSEAQNHDSAIVIGQMALEKTAEQFGEMDTATAVVLSRMGTYKWYRADYEEADSLYKRALSIREKTLGPNHPDVAKSLNNIGISRLKQGKYMEAEPLFRRALAIQQKTLGTEHPDVAKSLHRLGIVYSEQGKYAQAESVHRQALAIREKALGSDHPSVAASVGSLGIICYQRGKYTEAEPLYKRALAIQEKAIGSDHPDVAKSLNNLGLNYLEQGRYTEAEPLLERALAIWERALGPDHPYVAISVNNLATVQRSHGEFAEAEALYKRALVIEEKALGPDHPEVATSLSNLANLYNELGRYREAEPLIRQSLAILEKALRPDHPDVAGSLCNLGILLRDQYKYTEAELLLKRALAIDENALGADHPSVGITLNNLASLYDKQGKYTEAESLHKRTLSIWEKALGPDHPLMAEGLESFSQYHRLLGDTKNALEIAARACEIRKQNFQDASSVMSESDALTYSQFIRHSADNYLSCYLERGASDPGADKTAADILLSSKGQVSDGIFERGTSLTKETDSTTLALAESLRFTKFRLSQLYIQGPDEDVESYRNDLDSLSKLANDLEADLARHSASYRKQQDYRDVSVDRIASLQPENSVLVEYLLCNYLQLNPDSTIPHYLVVVLTEDSEPVIADLGEASDIDTLVSEYREHMLNISSLGHMPLKKHREEYEKVARKLYDVIIRPLEDHFSDKDLVFIASDGGLNLISFSGLIGDEGKYLVESYPIHYLSSGRDLIRLKDQQTSGQGLLAIGDPDYNATAEARLAAPGASVHAAIEAEDKYRTRNVRSGCGDLSQLEVEPLPHSRKEIELVAQQWAGMGADSAIIFFGPTASEDRFKAEAPGKRVVHLATHGYFLEGRCNPDVQDQRFTREGQFIGENPLLLSGLLFAGSNLYGQGADSAGVEDGVLSAYEVSAMNLDGTDLVVLSACETGLGEVKQGEGVYGLRRAFQMAGARTVVSALWPVSDKTTAEMMARVYAKSEESLAERIREAQLAQIKKLRSEGFADHPYNWAAFIALGDWR